MQDSITGLDEEVVHLYRRALGLRVALDQLGAHEVLPLVVRARIVELLPRVARLDLEVALCEAVEMRVSVVRAVVGELHVRVRDYLLLPQQQHRPRVIPGSHADGA